MSKHGDNKITFPGNRLPLPILQKCPAQYKIKYIPALMIIYKKNSCALKLDRN